MESDSRGVGGGGDELRSDKECSLISVSFLGNFAYKSAEKEHFEYF